ncbi:MAG: IS30 family transposase [Christensenellales bacterium]
MGQKQNNTRARKWKQLSEGERYKIEALLQAGLTPLEVSRRIGRDRRTVEREIVRGSVIQVDSLWRERLQYCADTGQRKHNEQAANKGRPLKIGHDHRLAEYIEKKIGTEKYSPDAVIGEIKTKGMSFETRLCTKTVYNYIDKRVFLNISNRDLPVKKDGKKQRYRKTGAVALNNLKGRSIDERPTNIESRGEPCHWEMDCVVGKGTACLLVMTERTSRKELIFKLKAKKQEYVIAVLDQLEQRYKGRFGDIFRSITMDNGCEFLNQEGLEASCLKFGIKRTVCYYAHPYSAWERGSNEVANKLIRRFVPKGTNIDKLTKAAIKRIEHWMNNYPRRMFGYRTANEIFAT